MKLIDKHVDKVFKYIKDINGNSCDITTRTIKIGAKKVGYIFLESVSNDDKISDFLVKSLTFDIKKTKFNLFEKVFSELQNTISNSKLSTINTYEDLFYYLASGFTAILVDGYSDCIVVETKNKLDRGVVEATTEAIVRGPKDSFTENYSTNIGLVRKRIKDPNLWFTEIKVGKRTKTKVSLAYLNDVVDKKKISLILDKLKKIDIDGILDSGYIREFLTNSNFGDFPKVISSERPDLACSSILDGKIVIMVENSPFVLIIPGLFVDFFHSAEDNYQLPLNVSITRLLRFVGFFITILTPAIYIALTTFDIKLIPSKLLISLATQRQGVPFPTTIEVLILLTAFEILRECDLRMPKQMGASVSIVGALILGDAAVAAGIVSPIAVIIAALTSIGGLLFSDIDVINSIRLWRIIFIIAATTLGLIGIVAAGIILITRLASIDVLGISYLSPFSPLNKEGLRYGILKFPSTMLKKRPLYLEPKDEIRLGDDNNEKN